MRPLLRPLLPALLALACAVRPGPTLTPPSGARFLPGQRFDVRVEGGGSGPFSAKLWLDGAPVAFSSGAQGTVESDGITRRGHGAFDRRGFSIDRPGTHTLRATFGSAGATAVVTSEIEVVPPSMLADGGDIRNVILLLGDGMGAAHRTSARIALAGDPSASGALAMDGMPATGAVTTRSRSSAVTDSAAGMSAYSIGNRVDNGHVGVFSAEVTSPFFAPRVEDLASYLHRTRGTSTGIVTTADVTDATPAATATYTGDRSTGTGIADQLLDEATDSEPGAGGSGLRVLLGGGRRWFLPAGAADSARSASTDSPALTADLAAAWDAPGAGRVDPGRDLLADFRARGFTTASTAGELAAATASSPPARLLGLFAPGNMTPALDKLAARRATGTTGEPMLDELTRAALAVLAGDAGGFFLMVEGALIDKESSALDTQRVVLEVLEFDRAVQAALEFARQDGHTLVMVVADHETGGLVLVGPDGGAGALPAGDGIPRYVLAADGYPQAVAVDGQAVMSGYAATWTSGGAHTAADVPISAYAPDERDWRPFAGAQRNVDVFFEIAAVLQRR